MASMGGVHPDWQYVNLLDEGLRRGSERQLAFRFRGGVVMIAGAQLVVFDPEAQRECSGNCRSILSLADEALAPCRVSVASVSRLPDLAGIHQPDLVVLRAPTRQPLKESVLSLRRLWPSAPVLAAICNILPAVSDLLESLAHGLD